MVNAVNEICFTQIQQDNQLKIFSATTALYRHFSSFSTFGFMNENSFANMDSRSIDFYVSKHMFVQVSIHEFKHNMKSIKLLHKLHCNQSELLCNSCVALRWVPSRRDMSTNCGSNFFDRLQCIIKNTSISQCANCLIAIGAKVPAA